MSMLFAAMLQFSATPVSDLQFSLIPNDAEIATLLKAINTQNIKGIEASSSDKFEKFVPYSEREVVSAERFYSDLTGCVYLHTVTFLDRKLSIAKFVCDLKDGPRTAANRTSWFTGIDLEIWGDPGNRVYRYNPTTISPLGAPPLAPLPVSTAKPKATN